MTQVISFLTTAFSIIIAVAASLPAVTVKGNAFFAGNNRFYIRGIDYQPGGSSDPVDPLADITTCKRDIAEFIKLGINTLRVYTIDNSKKHDECMNALDAAGIYLALDVNSSKYSINRNDPAPSYNHVYLQNVFATIDMFQQYTNLLMFFSGNEIINDIPTSASAPYIKAVTRDLKQYISNRQYRQIPVGYSAADIDENRVETAHYMNCGTDDQRVDFFAFNDYSWCDPSTYAKTYAKKVAEFGDYSQPIFLSEYGCITTTRKFEEVAALYGTDMTPVYSGGLVYQYTVEGDATQQKFGLVQVGNGNAVEQPDFSSLQTAFKNNPLPTGDGGYKQSGGQASNCPAASKTWLVGNDTLPAMPPQASQYFKNGAGNGPGLQGGSMDVGVETTATASAGSGKPTTTATPSKGAASNVRVPEFSAAPYGCGLAVLVSTLLGATLL